MFKPLTKNAESFITTAVLSGSSNVLTGSLPFALGRSNAPANTVFISNSKFKGETIVDPQTMISALIFWYNQYSEVYQIDANIMAAQAYVESGYRLWEYSNSGDERKTSAMGICQLYDNEIWDLFFTKPRAEVEVPKEQTLYNDNLALISLNMLGDISDIRNVIPYQDESTADTNSVAIENRRQLFQNLMNNTELMIQTQCRYMSEIGDRNNNLASSSLFAFAVNGYLTSNTYNEVINNASKQNLQVKMAMDYVEKIFKVLGGKFKAGLVDFGKDYKYDETPNDQANRNLSGSLLIDQGLQYPPVGFAGAYPEDTVKKIVKALKKYGITNQYLQAGILSVISTEGSFVAKSELSYSKTSNDRLRLIFSTRLSDLTETQLATLKTDDVQFYAKIYEGTFGAAYGNTTYGDGYKYRGRGFNGITFKSIYNEIGKIINIDLVLNPDKLTEIDVAADAVAAFYKKYLEQASKLGIPAKRYTLNSFNDINSLQLGVLVATQANVGWGKDLSSSIYPEKLRREMNNVGKLYEITLTA